ncbi:MAG: hypothetical protein KAX51_04535 [Chromatiaceae bacterium]|nr:hypothetical protein [Chromatiaceae bacterium]MBP6807584.1 hypothetical protein [Chromatiaceae bacterium]MBP8289064.1 hypothetical protein [Chromatiaceae bacterium]
MLSHRLRRAPFAAPVGTGVYHVATAASADATITIPAAAAVGDLAVLLDACDSSGAITSVVPAGWTLIKALLVTTAERHNSSYKILTSGDPGATLTGMTAAIQNKLLFVFRLAGGISSITVATNKGSAVTTNPTDLTAFAGSEPYVVVAGLSGGPTAGADWDSLTPAAHGSQLQGYLRGAYWAFNDAEGEDVSEVMGDWGAHTEVSLCALEVS